MLAKIAFLILSVGVSACVLLTVRQQRLEAVHDLADVQRSMSRLDQDLFRLRVAIAQGVAPERVTSLAVALGPMRPAGVDSLTDLLPPASAVALAEQDESASEAAASGGVGGRRTAQNERASRRPER